MFPEMDEANPPTTLTAVEEFERERQLKLPKAYKEFLLATNGGVPKYPNFPVRMPDRQFETIQSFSGIGVRESTDELAWSYDLYAGGIPQEVVPIAGNGSGDYICLDLRDGGEKVVFWDKRPFWGTGEWRESDLYHVANSFEEFLGSLRPDDF